MEDEAGEVVSLRIEAPEGVIECMRKPGEGVPVATMKPREY